MTLMELAAFLGKSRSTVKRWYAEGKIPPPDYDDRGWRMWTADQVTEILRKVTKTA